MAITKLISTLTTQAGTKVTKSLLKTGGGNSLLKTIEYAPNSRMAKAGIRKVGIAKMNADKSQDFISIAGENKLLYSGDRFRNLSSVHQESLIDFFKGIIKGKS